MIEVKYLKDVDSRMERRWQIDESRTMLVNPSNVVAASVFMGKLQNDDNVITNAKMVEMYFVGGFTATTLWSEGLEQTLRKEGKGC